MFETLIALEAVFEEFAEGQDAFGYTLMRCQGVLVPGTQLFSCQYLYHCTKASKVGTRCQCA